MATIGDLCCIRCLVLGDLTQVSLLPMTAFAGHAGNAGELARSIDGRAQSLDAR
jgi:hypothetical protein